MLRLLKNLVNAQGPVFLVHFVTNTCNANCAHCFIYSREIHPRYKGREMTLEEIKKAVTSLSSTLVSISLTGGEPFLRPDFNQIVNLYAQVAKVESINITTNASMPELIFKSVNQMVNDNPKTNFSITLSIDNIGRKHDENRRIAGLFSKLVKTFKVLKKIKSDKLTINFNLTVTPKNERDLKSIYNYLVKKLGAKSLALTALRFGSRCQGADFASGSYSKLNSLVNKGFEKGELEGQHGFIGADFYNAKNMLMRDTVEKTVREKRFLYYCQAGKLAGIMHANGDVYPCELLDKKMGNLRDFNYDFTKLWQKKMTKKIQKFIYDTKCFCTYECFMGVNFLKNPKSYPTILANYLKIKAAK